MKREVIAFGKTVEAAVAAGADELGVNSSKVTYEVIEAPKRGFLGIGESPAKVKVAYETAPQETALDFVKRIIADMQIDAEAELTVISEQKHEYLINIVGPGAAQLIGHHGDTLDSLQYLASLAANKREEDGSRNYSRISIDIEGYREKRAETLRRLARRMASRVQKYGRNVTLEPMNSYERRIIHSEIQNIEGVSTNSVGADDNRRVVIFSENSTRRSGVRRHEQRAYDADVNSAVDEDYEY